MIYVLIAVGVLLVGFAIWYFFFRTPSGEARILHLPLRAEGLKDIPAVPITISQLIPSLLKLNTRTSEAKMGKNGLSNVYQVGAHRETAYVYLFGPQKSKEGKSQHLADYEAAQAELIKGLEKSNDKKEVEQGGYKDRMEAAMHVAEKLGLSATEDVSLTQPEQFSMSWTTYFDIDKRADAFLPIWAKTMTDVETATREFWPTIAEYGTAFNLIVPERLGSPEMEALKAKIGAGWTEDHEAAKLREVLYKIDMSVFETLEVHQVKGTDRFTPATTTYLIQDSSTKTLIPFSIEISGYKGAGKRIFEKNSCSDSAWLYALMAAKTSISVWGIWIGHVYHWHIVTASMQMTMFNNFKEDHAVRELLAPQSDYLIAFDVILLLLWKFIAPPTSLNSGSDFLKLMNTFAGGRTYFDDDPHTTLHRLNIRAEDFTTDPNTPWDQYKVVQNLLYIWKHTEIYVNVFVNTTYADKKAVLADTELQNWFNAAKDPHQGNINFGSGFEMNSMDAVKKVLTSMIYRITAHGSSRMNSAANPGLSFVPNSPACLQIAEIPETDIQLSTEQFLAYLPKTHTIGEMVTFLFTFVFSAPYEPLIPIGGVKTDPFFKGGTPGDETMNNALFAFREAMKEFIPGYSPDSPLINQWPMSIET